jgi:hypothetical protein
MQIHLKANLAPKPVYVVLTDKSIILMDTNLVTPTILLTMVISDVQDISLDKNFTGLLAIYDSRFAASKSRDDIMYILFVTDTIYLEIEEDPEWEDVGIK